MQLNEYQKLAMMTDKGDRDISYYFLQLACECGEVLNPYIKNKYHGHVGDREKIKLELGDLLWFVSGISRNKNLFLQDVFDVDYNIPNDKDLTFYFLELSIVCSDVVQYYIDSKYFNNIGDNIKLKLKKIISHITEIGKFFELSLDDIMEANIEKLSKRYPEGYSNEKSINREV